MWPATKSSKIWCSSTACCSNLTDDPTLHSAFMERVATRNTSKGEELFESYGEQRQCTLTSLIHSSAAPKIYVQQLADVTQDWASHLDECGRRKCTC